MKNFNENIKEVSFSMHGQTISVVNWWRWFPLETKAMLLIEGSELDVSYELKHPNPNEPILRAVDVSEKIGNIEVFLIGVLRIKIRIFVNGEPANDEPIGWLDKMQIRLFG